MVSWLGFEAYTSPRLVALSENTVMPVPGWTRKSRLNSAGLGA